MIYNYGNYIIALVAKTSSHLLKIVLTLHEEARLVADIFFGGVQCRTTENGPFKPNLHPPHNPIFSPLCGKKWTFWQICIAPPTPPRPHGEARQVWVDFLETGYIHGVMVMMVIIIGMGLVKETSMVCVIFTFALVALVTPNENVNMIRARITNFEGHSISRPQQKGT